MLLELCFSFLKLKAHDIYVQLLPNFYHLKQMSLNTISEKGWSFSLSNSTYEDKISSSIVGLQGDVYKVGVTNEHFADLLKEDIIMGSNSFALSK